MKSQDKNSHQGNINSAIAIQICVSYNFFLLISNLAVLLLYHHLNFVPAVTVICTVTNITDCY